jgi:hypothetical protein
VLNVENARSAHPYDDVDVIDARAPRFNQVVVALVCAAALATGWWGLASLIGLQLAVGLILGRRWCLPCVVYFEVVQPRFGEGEIEDARPPRFANLLGASALALATGLHLAGQRGPGWVIVALVAALAGLAALTGVCVGCNIYRLSARLRGIRPGASGMIDLDEVGAPRERSLVVQFTHPLCTACRTVETRLRNEGHELVIVDISKQRALAHKYHVAAVPAAFSVGPDGRIISRLA